MTDREAALVGIDVGGTKTHLAVESDAGQREDLVVPSAQWRSGPVFSDPENLLRLADLVSGLAPVGPRTQVVAGLNGVDTPAQVRRAQEALVGRLGTSHVEVVNDAELLGPALGRQPSLQLIVGTGAVVLGRDGAGRPLRAFGFGWMLNDFGSAPALVREAVRELLLHEDLGRGGDVLGPLLLGSYGVADLEHLALAVSARAGLTEWGRLAPLVFQAAEQGSVVARAVIDHSARRLAEGVAALRRRGAVGSVVVAAGGVIVHQPRLQEAIRSRLDPDLRLIVLDRPPVEGALALARLRAASLQPASH
ncbi:hypothetical protein [Rathayibacter sp. VKM Ac-2760]|uniref:N-acetylglucosamine kinase n=1 Tax=Rathayibacter sp. VKM Ac-2760 TaxID=2609253 RepID=UPI001319B574|nr:hypothetical protein [Rathayibacter sp. VKM Ac-2760]QHC58653.1 hypothetical protein GSU72_08885 [Rathayibacter sp. VKM Ac-2760]